MHLTDAAYSFYIKYKVTPTIIQLDRQGKFTRCTNLLSLANTILTQHEAHQWNLTHVAILRDPRHHGQVLGLVHWPSSRQFLQQTDAWQECSCTWTWLADTSDFSHWRFLIWLLCFQSLAWTLKSRIIQKEFTLTTTQLQPTTLRGLPSRSILHRPTHSPSFLLSSTCKNSQKSKLPHSFIVETLLYWMSCNAGDQLHLRKKIG